MARLLFWIMAVALVGQACGGVASTAEPAGERAEPVNDDDEASDLLVPSRERAEPVSADDQASASLAHAREQCVQQNGDAGALPSSAARAQLECVEQGGSGCELAGLISQAAAECIAGAAGLQQRGRAWRSWLRYSDDYRRLIWDVMDGPGIEGMSGQAYILDAHTGIVLAKHYWAGVK